MLSQPRNGWVDISIGNWKDRASYLTDVGNDFLDALINLFKTHKPSAIRFDAEGWEYYILIDFYNTFVIECKDNYELLEFDVKAENIAKEIILDIEKNIDEWADWELDVSPSELKKEKQSLQNKINKLRALLEAK